MQVHILHSLTIFHALIYYIFKTLPKECTYLCGTATGLFLSIAADQNICTKQTISQLLIASGRYSGCVGICWMRRQHAVCMPMKLELESTCRNLCLQGPGFW